ncbi:N-6 DNA methylase [Streptomyces alkaliterrae]|uniref:N-6 DNA methylase n=1 Tax=Streptomyces alkaliterrae TaxID=2213162 RepID=A0A5P0YUI8_9ACTN|nr:N-6 DNA methylase [Streptomyces alkaliterrae]MBB1257274.1 N-6 DNA methylase [Streptomyces alkaliterrae]MQS03287.1 N-6 DNA methylase [Streptomyces alkaliterrae]
MTDSAPEVTAAGIARLAGVGRAAVSNWRRRHPDFPQPVGGTETSPAFALAEVERWLRAHGKLAEVPPRERLWQQLEADPRGAGEAVADAGERLLSAGRPAERGPLAEVADEIGDAAALDFLLDRYFETNTRQYTPTPPDAAALMAALAGPGDAVLDPACGSGALLAAAARHADTRTLTGVELDPVLARLCALRLAAGAAGAAEEPGGRRPAVAVAPGDALRAGPPEGEVDVVLCHPPFNERNWGHEELAYDPRWEYGLPARTESELAWVQHALAALRPGGTAVLLMPPAAASRRTGRRVRAALLRRGALRAVIALPAGAAPPHSLALHLWVLRRPGGPAEAPEPRLLVVDCGAVPRPAGRDGLDWPTLRATVLDTWHAFDAPAEAVASDRPGVSAALPVIDLLDDEVDLAPARHLPPADTRAGAAVLTDTHRELLAELGALTGSVPRPAASAKPRPPGPQVTVGELARSGALRVLTAGGEGTPVAVREGDVLVPVLGPGVPRVLTDADAGAELARPHCLLRVDPEHLDPWFVAGFLRATGNARQASSYTSSAARLDVRRLRLPRLALADQRPHAERFRALAEFEDSLARAGELGRRLVQGLHDGLAEGTVTPD